MATQRGNRSHFINYKLNESLDRFTRLEKKCIQQMLRMFMFCSSSDDPNVLYLKAYDDNTSMTAITQTVDREWCDATLGGSRVL